MKKNIDLQNIDQLEKFVQGNLNKGKIEFHFEKEILNNFSNYLSVIQDTLDYEDKILLVLKNIPYCFVNFQVRDHIRFDKKYLGIKRKVCKNCLYKNICKGFPVNVYKNLHKSNLFIENNAPLEVLIEVESKCNYNCQFCFNKHSFAKKDRNIIPINSQKIKKVLKQIKRLEIPLVRFTGGEPLLRKDIFELMAYAKNIGLEVRLNTNGSLVNEKNILKMKNIVDNVLIPIESWNTKKESEITGQVNVLENKINAIKLFKKIDVPIIRVGTVISSDIIKNFSKMEKFISSLQIDQWEFFRPITSKKDDLLTQEELSKIIGYIYKNKKKANYAIKISNALPFCVIKNKNIVNSVTCGAIYDDGHSRLVIDARGFIKPDYGTNIKLSKGLDIMTAWQNNFAQKIRDLKFLPAKCKSCEYAFKCRGGSRIVANNINNSWSADDPYAKY